MHASRHMQHGAGFNQVASVADLGKPRRLRRHDAPAASNTQPTFPASSIPVKNLWLFSATHDPTTAQ